MDNLNKMTDEQLNIAIAEELGWIKVESVMDMQIDLICQETYFSINKSGWLDAMGKDWDYHYNIFSPATSIGHAWVLSDSEKWTWTMHDYDDAIMKQLGVIEVTFDVYAQDNKGDIKHISAGYFNHIQRPTATNKAMTAARARCIAWLRARKALKKIGST